MPACGSPRLFAACHVLLRQSVPWHPPCALVRLISSRCLVEQHLNSDQNTVYLAPSCSVQLSRYALAIPENDIVKNVQSDPSVSLPLTLPGFFPGAGVAPARALCDIRLSSASLALLLPLEFFALACRHAFGSLLRSTLGLSRP